MAVKWPRVKRAHTCRLQVLLVLSASVRVPSTVTMMLPGTTDLMTNVTAGNLYSSAAGGGRRLAGGSTGAAVCCRVKAWQDRVVALAF